MMPSELFGQVGRALFGDRWKADMAQAINSGAERSGEERRVTVDRVDDWSKGRGRPPPQSIWVLVSEMVLERGRALQHLRRPIEVAAHEAWGDSIGRSRSEQYNEWSSAGPSVTHMPLAQLFIRCGQLLCGPDPHWKEHFAAMLLIKADTVDNMAKGTSEVPPAMWREIAAHIQNRENQAPGLRTAALQAAEAYTDVQIRPAVIGRAVDQEAVDHVNRHLRTLDQHHEFAGAAAWLERDGGLVVKVPRTLSVEAVEGLKFRISKEIADRDASDAE